MKNCLFLGFIVTGLLSGCSSYEGPTTASGQVVDRYTSLPVGNATVQVMGINSNTGVGGTTKGNAFPTDAQGRFSLSFDATKQANYTLFATTASGYASDYGDSPILSAGHKNENLLVKTAAPAWVKINCIDDAPASKAGLYTGGYSGSGDNQTIGPGNISYVRPTLSNLSTQVYWELSDSQGKITKGTQPYTAANFDTVTVTIHF